jgi:hypothetical protein
MTRVVPVAQVSRCRAFTPENAGVAKLAVFAYERGSGRPLWQSGNEKVASQPFYWGNSDPYPAASLDQPPHFWDLDF